MNHIQNELKIGYIHKCKAKVIKHLQDSSFSNGFLDMPPKAQVTKRKKMHKLDFNKLKHLHFKGHHQENEKRKHS